MSFSVKASHKLVNKSPESKPEVESYLDYSLNDILSPDGEVPDKPKPKDKNETQVVSGSGSGMAVRTSESAMSDYY